MNEKSVILFLYSLPPEHNLSIHAHEMPQKRQVLFKDSANTKNKKYKTKENKDKFGKKNLDQMYLNYFSCQLFMQ